jgi:hypothetical protein
MDPALTPLIQELAAGEEPGLAGLAMNVLAAQARFVQHYRRMELPLRDLPGDLFHTAVVALRAHSAGLGPSAEAGERQLRADFVESAGRFALIDRLVTGLQDGARRALAIDHAGLSIFATALAITSGQDRGGLILTIGGRQSARLALSLRAAGLADEAIATQFAFLHPKATLPEGFAMLHAESAVALLATSPVEAAL